MSGSVTMTPPTLRLTPAEFPPRQRPAEVLDALAAQLRERGLTRLYGASCRRFGVLSVAAGVTVWTNGRILWWHANGTDASWPAADHSGAARQLTGLMPGASPSLYPVNASGAAIEFSG